MTDRGNGTWFKAGVLPGVLVGATLTIGGAAPLALPLVRGLAAPTPYLAVEDRADAARTDLDADRGTAIAAPLAELNQALAAARAKLDQLNRATAALAGVGALRAELSAKEEENRRLLTELQTLRARRAEWQRADDAAKAQISGLGQALDEAVADTKKREGELAALRSQSAELGTSLDRVRSEGEAVRAELGARVDELMASVAASGSEIGRLSKDLASRSDDLAAATGAQLRSAARVLELEEAVAGVDEDLRSLGTQLSASTERLNVADAARAASEEERDTALAALDEERGRADRLRGALALAEADLEQVRTVNRGLETRSASLEQAATMATDAARQNLRAVENQIAALNATLAEVELLPPADAPGAIASGEAAPGAAAGGAIEPGPEQPEQTGRAPAVVEEPVIAPAAGPIGQDRGEIALVRLSEPEGRDSSRSLASLLDELPVEGRIQAQSLLADLDAETDPQGLKLIVPGGELFAVNSEEVRSTAYDSLAKVAELINLYEDQPITIIGHTDAVGAPDYNKTLSLRRAGLVRQFFIDHFDVEAERLATQGMGEQHPIASNATAAGRRANRRVEVLIFN